MSEVGLAGDTTQPGCWTKTNLYAGSSLQGRSRKEDSLSIRHNILLAREF